MSKRFAVAPPKPETLPVIEAVKKHVMHGSCTVETATGRLKELGQFGWDAERSRERDECITKLQRLGLVS